MLHPSDLSLLEGPGLPKPIAKTQRSGFEQVYIYIYIYNHFFYCPGPDVVITSKNDRKISARDFFPCDIGKYDKQHGFYTVSQVGRQYTVQLILLSAAIIRTFNDHVIRSGVSGPRVSSMAD